MEEENDEDQTLPAKATEEDILKEINDDENKTEVEENDTFVYLKSSSIISILIIVLITLICILATSVLIKTVLHSHGITHTLSVYFGFTPNRTIDESTLTYWSPHSIYDEQPIEITTTIINSSSTNPPPSVSPVILTPSERKAQKIFRNIILPTLFLLSIFCGILAFYLRLHHYGPAWGARPKCPDKHITIELE